jgi:hypothetical protein
MMTYKCVPSDTVRRRSLDLDGLEDMSIAEIQDRYSEWYLPWNWKGLDPIWRPPPD